MSKGIVKKLSVCVLAFMVLAVAAVSVSAGSAYALDRDYNAKYDSVFEDFDRADISDTVTATGTPDLGEKPYLSVDFTAENSGSPDDSIFKQGQNGENGVGNIVLIMRAPDGDVTLAELMLGTRYGDDYQVYGKSLADLADGDGEALPALTTEWQKYIINFANSYEDDEVYSDVNGATNIKVNTGSILGFHLYAAAEAVGRIEIQSIYTTTDAGDTVAGSRTMWNDFLGADTVDKTKASSAWWAGSSTGVIVKRRVVLSDGDIVNVINANKPAGTYGNAVIVAADDVDNLSVAFTSDGTTWSAYVPYDTSFEVTSNVYGFSLKYEGTGTVSVSKIFYTNFEEDVVASAIPVIDGASSAKLDDFNVAQTGISGDYDAMAGAPQMTKANLYYRLSYKNADKIAVADGKLVLDATSLAANDYINFKTQTRTAAKGYSHILFKVKAADGATLDGFRFALGKDGTLFGDAVWKSGWKADVGLNSAGLDDANPYAAEDGYYYVVIDMAESGLAAANAEIDTIDVYYSGTGKLYIDEIIFANKMADIVVDSFVAADTVEFVATDADYQYGGGFNINDAAGKFNVLALTIVVEEGTDLSGVRIEMGGGTFWGSENAQGTLSLVGGGTLADVEFVAGEAKTVYIDLVATGAVNPEQCHIHTNGTATGNFAITKIEAMKTVPPTDAVILDDGKSLELDGFNKTFEPTGGYAHLGYVSAMDPDSEYGYIRFTVTAATDVDLSNVRFEFMSPADVQIKFCWFAENAQGTLKGIGGAALVTELAAGESAEIVIDLAQSGIEEGIGAFHVHSNGAETGNFTVSGAELVAKKDFYADAISDLPVYEVPDVVAPTVEITTATTAVEGDKIIVTYTASDDVTANPEITISVMLGSSPVTLDADNSFIAQVGTYTVTVTARDEGGNSAEDVIQITVSAKPVAPETDDNDDTKKDINVGAIVGGVVGGVAGVAIIVVLVLYFVKKKKKTDDK